MNICKTKNGKQVVMNTTFRKTDYIDNLICIDCEKEVSAKQGHIKIWHFAHKANTNCPFSISSKKGNKMSKFHRDFQDLFNSEIDTELEKVFGNNRADVYANNRVVEIQHSQIGSGKIMERTNNYKQYTKKYPIWILDVKGRVNINNFPKEVLIFNVSVPDEYVEIIYMNQTIRIDNKKNIMKYVISIINNELDDIRLKFMKLLYKKEINEAKEIRNSKCEENRNVRKRLMMKIYDKNNFWSNDKIILKQQARDVFLLEKKEDNKIQSEFKKSEKKIIKKYKVEKQKGRWIIY